MAKQPAEQIAEAASEALTKGGEAAEKIMKGNADALSESGSASRAAGDLHKLGIIDPTKVVRTALQDQASVDSPDHHRSWSPKSPRRRKLRPCRRNPTANRVGDQQAPTRAVARAGGHRSKRCVGVNADSLNMDCSRA